MGSREEYQQFIIGPDEAVAYSPPRHQATVNLRYLSQGQLGSKQLEIVVGGPRPGGGGEPHYHEGVEQYVYVLQGQGISEIEDEQFEVGPNTLIYHPPGQMHRELAVSEDFRVLVIYSPPLGLQQESSFKQREGQG